MKLLDKRSQIVASHVVETGELVESFMRWTVRMEAGQVLTFDQVIEPTADEILAKLPIPGDELEPSSGAGRTRAEIMPALERVSALIAGNEAAHSIAVRAGRAAWFIDAIEDVGTILLDRYASTAQKFRDAT